jgi:cellulose synthase operon protein C
MRSTWLAIVVWFLLLPVPVHADSGLPLLELSFGEQELRLLLAERNLARGEALASQRLGQQFTLESRNIQLHYSWARESHAGSARRNRFAAAVRLEQFVALHTDSTHGPEALLRLAAVRLEEADARYSERMQTYLRRDVGDEGAGEPRKDYSRALDALHQLLDRYPASEHREIAWYLLGYSHHENGNDQAAMEAFESLLAENPASLIRDELLVRVGDYYFERSDLDDALRYYGAGMQIGGNWLDRAMYKYAWTLYRLNRHDEAIDVFTALADLGRERPDLLAETLRYLAISYIEGGGLDYALHHMERRGARFYDEALLREVASVLYESTDFPGAISAYTLAMQRTPLEAVTLELAQRRLSALHQQRLIQDAVQERLNFVARFAPEAPWFQAQQATSSSRRIAETLSERFLYEYATYHHFHQLRGVTESTVLAEAGYRRYLARFAARPRAVQMAFYLAEMLYDRHAYPEAISYYTRVAYSAPDPATSVASRAAYHMVLAARNLYKRNSTDAAELDRLLAISHRFADLRPTDQRTPLVLYHAGHLLCEHKRDLECRRELKRVIDLYPEEELAVDAIQTVINSYARENKYGSLADWADRLLNRGHPTDPSARRQVVEIVGAAMFREAHAQDQAGEHETAVERYLRVYERYGETPAGVTALFNAGHGREKQKRYLDALTIYEQLITRHPDDRVAARAAFRRAWIYEQVIDYPNAVAAYEHVVAQYPDTHEARDALYNIGALYALLEDHGRSAQVFLRHHARFGRSATRAADAVLRAAAQWELAGEGALARDSFMAYTRLPHLTASSAYAAYRAALLSAGEERGRILNEALALYERVAKETGASDPGLLGALRFELAELERERYMAMRLPRDLAGAGRVLNQKAKLLTRLRQGYTLAIGAGDGVFAVASLYRIGEAYMHFSEMLFEAPIPPGLNEEEAEIYRFELESQAAPLEEQALETFRLGRERARQENMASKWTALIERSLDRQPVRVRLLTAHLEPIYLGVARGLPPAVDLALVDSVPRGAADAASDAAQRQTVADYRLENLMRDSAARQRIFFDEARPFVNRFQSSQRPR